MHNQPQSRAPVTVAIVLLLLPVLYVGSYLAMVVPFGGFAFYRYGGQVSACIFWPLQQIDQQVRPGAWQPLPTIRPQDYLCPSHP